MTRVRLRALLEALLDEVVCNALDNLVGLDGCRPLDVLANDDGLL